MLRFHRSFVRSALLLSVFVLFGGPLSAETDMEITILHTSDLHGAVIPDAAGRPKRGSLARVAHAVKDIRSKSGGRPVILLDSGDTLQGTAMEEFFDVRWAESSPTIEAMNHLGYKAMAVGNHDFNFGLDILRKAQEQAEFPFLAANALLLSTGKPAFPPFEILEFSGLRIGILGLITPNIPAWEAPANFGGLRFEAMDLSAEKWVPRLRRDEGCDLIIVLAHTGFEKDVFSGKRTGTEAENYAERLSRVPGIDLLLTGHVHEDIPPTLHNGVIISEPLAHGRRLSRIDLKLSRQNKKWEITSFAGENINLDVSPVDPEMIAIFSGRRDRLMKALAQPLTRVQHPISIRHCREEDCAGLDLIHRVQLEASGADISMASLLSDQTPDLEAGSVTRNWVSSLYTYPNTLRMVSVTGAELLDIMEYAARYYSDLICLPGQACRLQANPDVRHYNVDSFEGISYRIDPKAPEGHRIWDLRWKNRPLDPEAEFKLVCNNYRVAGGGAFPHLHKKKILWKSSRLMADLIAEYLESKELWVGEVDSNWIIAPRLGKESVIEAKKRP